MATNILMPALSPTMEEGKLAKWLVKEGDTVKSGDILAEIETDKATMEFEAVDEGRIGKILVAEGSEGVKVNSPIAVLLADGESADAVPAAQAKQDIPAAMKDIGAAVKAEVGAQKTDTAKTAEARAEPAKPTPVAASSSGSYMSAVISTTSSRMPSSIVFLSIASILRKKRRLPSSVASSSSRNAESSGRRTAIAPISHMSHIERWAPPARIRRRISSKRRGLAARASSRRDATMASYPRGSP